MPISWVLCLTVGEYPYLGSGDIAILDSFKQRQAEAELGQAQLKLGLDFTLIFCTFGLLGWFNFVYLIL